METIESINKNINQWEQLISLKKLISRKDCESNNIWDITISVPSVYEDTSKNITEFVNEVSLDGFKKYDIDSKYHIMIKLDSYDILFQSIVSQISHNDAYYSNNDILKLSFLLASTLIGRSCAQKNIDGPLSLNGSISFRPDEVKCYVKQALEIVDNDNDFFMKLLANYPDDKNNEFNAACEKLMKNLLKSKLKSTGKITKIFWRDYERRAEIIKRSLLEKFQPDDSAFTVNPMRIVSGCPQAAFEPKKMLERTSNL